MTYYTIPYKENGDCCPVCPVVQGCDCEECCNFDENYTGKKLYISDTLYESDAGNFEKTLQTYVGTYAGGGVFNGTWNIDYYQSAWPPDPPAPECYDFGSPVLFFSSSYAETYTVVCNEAGGWYDLVRSGSSGLFEFFRLRVDSGLCTGAFTPCEPDGDYRGECTATVSSSCFAMFGYYRACTEFYAEDTCENQTYSNSIDWTVTASIAP